MSLLLHLLVAASVICIVCGQISLPYNVTFNNRADDSNSLTLRCIDQFGVEVPGAIFYRNSQQITNSSCLTAYPTGSSSVLNLTLVSQECDGYFSCGVNGTLSEPKPLYACPRTNVSADGRTEVIEEGTDFLLTCDFPPSPIKQYTTVWYKGHGSVATDIQDTPELQSYTLLSAQPNEYFCQVQPSINKCNIYSNSPSITILVIKRYEAPMITKDLNYTRYTNGDGVFSVSTSGTNLTHKWYKNDRLINRTGAGILDIGDDFVRVEDSNGLLRITYEASNVDYDNMTQTTRQTFGLYSNMTNVSRDVYEDKYQVLTIILLVVIGTVCIAVVILLVLVILYFKCRAAHGVCNKCQYEESMEPTERCIIYSYHIVKDCKTDCAILKCMHTMLSGFMRTKKFSGTCVDLLKPMRQQLEEYMKDKTLTDEENVIDNSGPQHQQDNELHKIYKKLHKLVDGCIKKATQDDDQEQDP